MDITSPYNVILGQPSLNALVMKLSIEHGIGKISNNIKTARSCHLTATKVGSLNKTSEDFEYKLDSVRADRKSCIQRRD